MDILARIDLLLSEKGWSRSELLRRIDLTPGMFERWKRNQASPEKHLPRIAEELDTSIAYLRGESQVAHPGAADTRRGVPILGTIKAGIPVWSGENFTDETVDIDDSYADMAMIVSGDSMIYSGIFEGDIVLLKRATSAQRGQIVAAVKDDGFGSLELTLKYYEVDRIQGPLLRAANAKYQDMPMSEGFQIIGVFAGLVRYHEPRINETVDVEIDVQSASSRWSKFVQNAISAGLEVEDLVGVLNMVKKIKK